MSSPNTLYNEHSTQTYQDVVLAIYRDNFGRVDVAASNGAGRLIVPGTTNHPSKASDILDPKYITEQAHRFLNINIQTDSRFKFDGQTSSQTTIEQTINQVMRELPPSSQLTDIISNRILRPDLSTSAKKDPYYRDHCYKSPPAVTEAYRDHYYKITSRDTAPEASQSNVANHVDVYSTNANMIVPNAMFATFSNILPSSVDVTTVSETKKDYATHVRTLQYVAMSNSDCIPTFLAFGAALARMSKINSLTIDVRTHHATFLIHLLYNSSIARSIATNYGIKIPLNIPRRSIPNLQSFTLHGPIRMLKLIPNHNLMSLSMSEPLDEFDFDYLIQTVDQWPDIDHTLRNLILTLDIDIAAQMELVLEKLNSVFPGLENLVIRAPDAQALKTSKVFAKTPIILPRLRSFSLNDRTILPPRFVLKEKIALSIQLADVKKSGDLRESLTKMTFGTIHWTRESHGNKWIIVEHSTSEDASIDEGYPILFQDHPELWKFSTEILVLVGLGPRFVTSPRWAEGDMQEFEAQNNSSTVDFVSYLPIVDPPVPFALHPSDIHHQPGGHAYPEFLPISEDYVLRRAELLIRAFGSLHIGSVVLTPEVGIPNRTSSSVPIARGIRGWGDGRAPTSILSLGTRVLSLVFSVPSTTHRLSRLPVQASWLPLIALSCILRLTCLTIHPRPIGQRQNF
ncbi:hypothetical protein GALMADRAFT_136304 [Galerina marginata CBS 339.88]|uniref:Uncharacterized protein n=1 Tax=Galerina marginata (strain CBS 339.88) TaxID=685588 RepID=A0A067TDI1_GALM3|nr:hypothetical protein GALMADRAFT_136304 [Galerina marginata CBS 339.88]